MAKARRVKLKRGTTHYGKPKSQVTLPGSDWDMGPKTAAQAHLKVIEDANIWDEEKQKWVNPNGVKRARRVDLVEAYHAQGKIDRRALLAALTLRTSYEATMKSAPAIKKIQVDTFPKPDQHIAIIIDRISRFSNVYGMVPATDRPIIDCVVLRNAGPNNIGFKGSRYARGMALLQDALTRLADRLDL
jgi:hypothetical protein